MMQTEKQKAKKSAPLAAYSYQEVIQFLDKKWDSKLARSDAKQLLQLDAALGSPSKKVKAIFVAGTNGKSTTINLAAQLLRTENLTIGSFYSPHLTIYNERIAINNEAINNTAFTQTANEVLNAAATLGLDLHARDILVMMALHHFAQQKVAAAILEVANFDTFDPVTICSPLICAVTRVTDHAVEATEDEIRKRVAQIAPLIKKGCYVVSADQSKSSLQVMEDLATEKGAQWAMPIRKLATLRYPFEQLHGRCAALAERIAQTFVQHIADPKTIDEHNSLLAKPKGQRGRPTLEAKRNLELNPKRTVEQFWQETVSTLPARFELLEKSKPMVLLDTASNIDAFANLLLGIRLLHYKHPLKGLVIIVGCDNNALHHTEFCKMLRYFFKKTAGQVIFCPVTPDAQSTAYNGSWDIEQITNDVKNMKVKARSAKSLAQALELAKKSVDETSGLVVVTGSRTLVSEYSNTHKSKK